MDSTKPIDRAGVKLSAPLLILSFIWWYFFLEAEHQRIFLFLIAILKFAEYFTYLPEDLEQYQEEDWWDVPTIKKALMMLGIFWTIAFLSSKLPSAKLGFLKAKTRRVSEELPADD